MLLFLLLLDVLTAVMVVDGALSLFLSCLIILLHFPGSFPSATFLI